MQSVNAINASLSRLETHRSFVSGLLQKVPELQTHATMTQTVGPASGYTPEQMASRLVDRAWLTDGISNRAKERILALIQALPNAGAKLPADKLADLDAYLQTSHAPLFQKAWGPCCLMHRRTFTVTDAIEQIRGELPRAGKPAVVLPPRPDSSAPPRLLKPISIPANPADQADQLAWEPRDQPMLKAPPPSPCGSEKAPLEPPTGEGVIRPVAPPEAMRQAQIAELRTSVQQLEAERDIVAKRLQETGLEARIGALKARIKRLPPDSGWMLEQNRLTLQVELKPYAELLEQLDASIQATRDQLADALRRQEGQLPSSEVETLLKP